MRIHLSRFDHFIYSTHSSTYKVSKIRKNSTGVTTLTPALFRARGERKCLLSRVSRKSTSLSLAAAKIGASFCPTIAIASVTALGFGSSTISGFKFCINCRKRSVNLGSLAEKFRSASVITCRLTTI
jgi:hypothetical protein